MAWGIAVVGLAIDQATKALALARLDPENPPVLLGGLLTLQLVRNPGAAFSFGGTPTKIAGTGSAVNTAYLYSNVITIGGQQIDAIVTLTGLSGATLDSFDSTANPYANTGYFQPNLTLSSVGG